MSDFSLSPSVEVPVSTKLMATGSRRQSQDSFENMLPLHPTQSATVPAQAAQNGRKRTAGGRMINDAARRNNGSTSSSEPVDRRRERLIEMLTTCEADPQSVERVRQIPLNKIITVYDERDGFMDEIGGGHHAAMKRILLGSCMESYVPLMITKNPHRIQHEMQFDGSLPGHVAPFQEQTTTNGRNKTTFAFVWCPTAAQVDDSRCARDIFEALEIFGFHRQNMTSLRFS